MCENSDQALLFGEAIFNDLVADEKRLHGRLGDIDHVAFLGEGAEGKTASHCPGQYMAGMEFSRDNGREART